MILCFIICFDILSQILCNLLCTCIIHMTVVSKVTGKINACFLIQTIKINKRNTIFPGNFTYCIDSHLLFFTYYIRRCKQYQWNIFLFRQKNQLFNKFLIILTNFHCLLRYNRCIKWNLFKTATISSHERNVIYKVCLFQFPISGMYNWKSGI